MFGAKLAERGLLPDGLVRFGIRRMLRRLLAGFESETAEAIEIARRRFHAERRDGPIALAPELSNQQHYEVPPEFFEQVLGPRLKYSCAYWAEGVTELAAAEDAMLALSAERAELEDGQQVLDLGCGWGSFAIWVAEHHPNSRVLAVSNSKPQREWILHRCEERGIDRVEVVTADVNDFSTDRRFDRVVSVEMFEHVRNHDRLIERIGDWMAPDGALFVHHFSHREYAYPYEDRGSDDWMARNFFTGGMMPSDDLLLRPPRGWEVDQNWRLDGRHYQKTCEAWLARQDAHRETLRPILAGAYGEAQAALWHQRWRMFFMACAELFGFRGGSEWGVTHVRLRPRREPR